MTFVENEPTLQGALVRTFVFQKPGEGDAAIIQEKIDEILAEQRDDGSFGDTSKETGERLLRLLQLGFPSDSPEVGRGVEALLRQKRAGQNANEWVEKEGALSIYALHALCLLGRSDIPEVRFSLNWYVEHPEEWNDPWKGCPWTPEVFWSALWAGRGIEDTQATVNDGLRLVAQGMSAAGCNAYNDPYGFLEAAGQIDSADARALVEKQIPMILRGQRADGGWGDSSLFVFRALKTHGCLDTLRDLPPLPPDWEIVRSIPAPGGDLWSMTWDGERLWVYDRESNSAIAVSPEDGSVVAKLDLPVDNVVAIGWWDSCLAVTQNDPKKLFKVDPATGEIRQDIIIDETDWTWVGCANEVNGKVWVVDEFSPGIIVIDPASPDERQLKILAGPGPNCFAPTPDGVWHADFWAHTVIKTGYDGKLLHWGDRIFEHGTAGLAFDGENLWAVDGVNRRICVIEKAETGVDDEMGRSVLLESVANDFRSFTDDLASHQIVFADTVYPQPCVYLVMHLIEMRAAGWTDVDFDTVSAVSGASALFAYEPGEFMPKYANLHIDMDRRIAEATGFGYEWVPFEDVDAAWPIIKESIDSGRPLKGWYWENLLIGGYDEAPEREDRRVFVMADGPDTVAEWWPWPKFVAEMSDWPHRFGRFSRRANPLPPRETAVRVMRDLVAWSVEPPKAVQREFPEAKFGLEGMGSYAADCADTAAYEDWSACHDINPQWTLRNSTAVYLERVAHAGLFPPGVSEEVARAAREYRAAYAATREFYDELGHGAPSNAGRTKARRLAGSSAVRRALEHERAAVSTLAEALDALK
jgi:hypothetical protein